VIHHGSYVQPHAPSYALFSRSFSAQREHHAAPIVRFKRGRYGSTVAGEVVHPFILDKANLNP